LALNTEVKMKSSVVTAAVLMLLTVATIAQTAPGVIPAGTSIRIRTNEDITARSNDVGREYSAEIASDIVGPSGAIVVPKGAPAELAIAKGTTSKMGVGSNEISLALRSIRTDGHTYMVDSDLVQKRGERGLGANRRTAEMTGGGALLGTLIGAIAGGGKGAAIGAAVGAAGGATTQVLTRGHEVKIPAESVLTFRLDEPIRLQ